MVWALQTGLYGEDRETEQVSVTKWPWWPATRNETVTPDAVSL